jgi:hypothetical protein
MRMRLAQHLRFSRRALQRLKAFADYIVIIERRHLQAIMTTTIIDTTFVTRSFFEELQPPPTRVTKGCFK